MSAVPKKPVAKTVATRKTPVRKKVVTKPSDRKANTLFIIIFFFAAFILYGNTILNKWALDDEFVTHNATVKKGLKAIPEIFSTFYVSTSGNIGAQSTDYRPIVKLTFALEYQLFGEKPGRSHIINVLFYFFGCLLLFFILRRLLHNYNILFPFLITLAFMAHPVHTEVVASLKNRDILIAFLGGLGAMYYFLRYAETKKSLYFLPAALCFFVGYLSKSSILPFLLIYPLTLYFFTDLKPKTLGIIAGVILVAALMAHFIPRLFLPPAVHVKAFIENPLYLEKSLWVKTGTGMVTLLFYLRLLVFPYPLVYYYGYDMIPITDWANIWVILSFLVNAGLLFWAIRKFREKHILSFAILFYFIFIAMYSNILIPVVGIVAERFVFEASLGFVMALVYLIFRLFRTDPKSLTIEFNDRAKIVLVIAVLLLPSTYYTIKRNRAWRNLYDLYARDMRHLERSSKAHISYAGELMKKVYSQPENKVQSAIQTFAPTIIEYFEKGLAIYPDNYQTLNDLATVFLNMTGQPDSAIHYLHKAIKLRPDLQPAWVNMGMAYKMKKDPDSAILAYEKVLKINPKEYKAVFAIANIYYEKGDVGRAVSMNEQVIRDHPELDAPYVNLGNYAFMRGDTTAAIQQWLTAAKKRPSAEVFMQLSQTYRALGNSEQANYFYGLALDEAKKR